MSPQPFDSGNAPYFLQHSTPVGSRESSIQIHNTVTDLHLDVIRMRQQVAHPAFDALKQDLVVHGLGWPDFCFCPRRDTTHAVDKIFTALADRVFAAMQHASGLAG